MELQDIRILVVDDEESIRTVIVQVLESEGYQVMSAASGEEAYGLFDASPYDLVITDIKMPNMSGIDLLVKVKDRNPDTEVIIITSHASLDTSISAIKHGAYDYLLKPFEDIELIAAVAKRVAQKIRLVAENRALLDNIKKNAAELERANEQLQQLVIRDALTGAFNHRYFYEALSQELIRSERHQHSCSLVFFDVDDFKWYNDTCGHQWGDEVLRTLAKTAQERLRRSDVLARYGGEEFVVILPETPKPLALRLAEEIRANVEQFPFSGREVMDRGAVTISAGVATYPEDGDDATTLVKNADAAMYEAKRAGKNQVR